MHFFHVQTTQHTTKNNYHLLRAWSLLNYPQTVTKLNTFGHQLCQKNVNIAQSTNYNITTIVWEIQSHDAFSSTARTCKSSGKAKYCLQGLLSITGRPCDLVLGGHLYAHSRRSRLLTLRCLNDASVKHKQTDHNHWVSCTQWNLSALYFSWHKTAEWTAADNHCTRSFTSISCRRNAMTLLIITLRPLMMMMMVSGFVERMIDNPQTRYHSAKQVSL